MECTVCSQPAFQNCAKCFKVKYCSKECQLQDWKSHKIDCFPLKVESSKELGRYLVATKDIQQWDLVVQEKPLVTGPLDTKACEPVCLGCFAILENNYVCRSCSWPVCNSRCEKVKNHADYECKILSNRSVKFSKNSWVYIQIKVLRSLLMKKINPRTWKEILSLQSTSGTGFQVLRSIVCLNFIRDVCKLTEYSQKEIEHVLGVIGINSFEGEDYEENKLRSGSYLYKTGSIAAHNCIPNCYRLIDQKVNYQLRACVDIPTGSSVTTFYANTWKPTLNRQESLKTNYSFTCNCKRCIDPTELETFFSGIKCSVMSDDNCSGYLIPKVPLDPNTKWECLKCNFTTDNDRIVEFDLKFEEDIGSVSNDITLENFQKLERIAKSYQAKVHPNHYHLIDLEYEIAHVAHNLLASNAISETVIKQKNIPDRLMSICYHQLEVADIIRPGFTVFRGKVLHMLQHIKMVKLLQTRPRPNALRIKREIAEIEEMRATALKILSVEPGDVIRPVVDNLIDDSEMLACKFALGIQK